MLFDKCKLPDGTHVLAHDAATEELPRRLTTITADAYLSRFPSGGPSLFSNTTLWRQLYLAYWVMSCVWFLDYLHYISEANVIVILEKQTPPAVISKRILYPCSHVLIYIKDSFNTSRSTRSAGVLCSFFGINEDFGDWLCLVIICYFAFKVIIKCMSRPSWFWLKFKRLKYWKGGLKWKHAKYCTYMVIIYTSFWNMSSGSSLILLSVKYLDKETKLYLIIKTIFFFLIYRKNYS